MSLTAAEAYMSQWDAAMPQFARSHSREPSDPDMWVVLRRHDPHRPLDVGLRIIASYVRPEDVVIDVGGGAGRISLPLALRCREVINVDRAPAARVLFEETAQKAGITNVRFAEADWDTTQDIQGDVVLGIDMLGSNREIVPLLEKLALAARRRVIIQARSFRTELSPPQKELFRLLRGEEFQPMPGYEELLPVLLEMEIWPTVHMVPPHFLTDPSPDDSQAGLPETRKEVLESTLQRIRRMKPEAEARVRAFMEAHFDELYLQTPEGFKRRVPQCAYPLITWETHSTTS